MDQVAKELGLIKRGNIFWYRRRIPQDLVRTFGRREIKESLGTSDKAEAKVRLHEAALKWARKFSEARCSAGRLTAETICSEIIRFVSERSQADADAVHAFDKQYPNDEDATDAALRETRRNIRTYANRSNEQTLFDINALTRELFARYLPSPTKSSSFIEQIEIDARIPDITSHLLPEEKEDVGRLLWQALLERERRNLDVLEGRERSDAHNARFLPPGKKPVTLRSAIDDFLQEYFTSHKLTLKRQQSLRSEADLVLFMMGSAQLVSQINRAMTRKFRDNLNQLPSNITKRFPNYREMPLRDIVSETKTRSLPRMKRATQAKYITMLKGALEFATNEGHIDSNPALDLKPLGEKAAAKRARNPFEIVELAKIFHATPYDAGSERHGDRYWAPLIGLFSGLRLNEICQLDISDVRRATGDVWFIDVSANEDSKTVKNDRSQRCVPIHSELIKLGFLRYVIGEKKKRLEGKLFEDVTRTDVRNYGARVSKWFNRTFLVNAGVKNEKNGFHSFRHTFKDALTRAEIYQDAIDALGGWNTIRSGSSGLYGNGPSIDQLKTAIEKVSYPGLDLSHLYDPEH